MVRTCRFLPRIGRSGKVGGEDRRKGATSISMVLSMPAKTDPEALKASAENTGNKRGHGSAGSTGLKMGQSC
jgi:hypothetical protein